MADNNHRDNRGPLQPPANPSYGEEDPLVELARIVSEDGGFYKPSRSRQAGGSPQDAEPDAFSPELEAEILEELNTAPAHREGADTGSELGPADFEDADLRPEEQPGQPGGHDYYDAETDDRPAAGVPEAEYEAGHPTPYDAVPAADSQDWRTPEPDPYAPAADARESGVNELPPETDVSQPDIARFEPGGQHPDDDYDLAEPWRPDPVEPVNPPIDELADELVDELETGDYYAADRGHGEEGAQGHQPAQTEAGYAEHGTDAEQGPDDGQTYAYPDDDNSHTSLADTLDPDFRQALDGRPAENPDEYTPDQFGESTSDLHALAEPGQPGVTDGSDARYYDGEPSDETAEFEPAQASDPRYDDTPHEIHGGFDTDGMNLAAAADGPDGDLTMSDLPGDELANGDQAIHGHGAYAARESEPDVFADTLGELAPDESVYEDTGEDGSGLSADRTGYQGLEFAEPNKSRVGMFAIAAILAVVIIGGGLAATIGVFGGSQNDGAPPLIRADESDVKQVPEQMIANAEDDGTGQAVFDSVSGQNQKTEEKLIDNIEAPREVARIILPESGISTETGLGTASGDAGTKLDARIPSDTALPQTGPKYDPIGPRKVRTVIVKPDGTIVQNSASAIKQPSSTPLAGGDAGSAVDPALSLGDEIGLNLATGQAGVNAPEPVKVRTINVSGNNSPATTAVPTLQPGPASSPDRIMETTNTATGGSEIAIAALEAPGAGQASGAVPKPRPANAPIQPVEVRQPAPQQPAVIRAAPERQANRPVDLLASAPARTTPAAAPPVVRSGNAFVQLSSQRSADQARSAFRGLQRRYPQLLSGYEPNIQRADISGKGTYYRVRVGPLGSRDAAGQLCNQIKASGGSCYVP